MLSPNPSSHLLSCSDPAIERSIEMQEEDFRNVMKMKTFKCWVGLWQVVKKTLQDFTLLGTETEPRKWE